MSSISKRRESHVVALRHQLLAPQGPCPSPRHCITWALYHSSLDKRSNRSNIHARDHFLKVSVSLASPRASYLSHTTVIFSAVSCAATHRLQSSSKSELNPARDSSCDKLSLVDHSSTTTMSLFSAQLYPGRALGFLGEYLYPPQFGNL